MNRKFNKIPGTPTFKSVSTIMVLKILLFKNNQYFIVRICPYQYCTILFDLFLHKYICRSNYKT